MHTLLALHGFGVGQMQRQRGVHALAGLLSQLLRQLPGAGKAGHIALGSGVGLAVRQCHDVRHL